MPKITLFKAIQFFAIFSLSISLLHASSDISKTDLIDSIYTDALLHGTAMDNLNQLVEKYPGRLSGSNALEGAVRWAGSTLETLNLDRVHKQFVMVPHWVRGSKEQFSYTTHNNVFSLNGVALGGSSATPPEGLDAEIIEVSSFLDLERIGSQAKGKIIFINHGVDQKTYLTMQAYADALIGRTRGPAKSSALGSVATLVRSMTLDKDDVPHTGATLFPPGINRIPAAALGYVSADNLHKALIQDPHLKVHIAIHSETLPDSPSSNVIGEIKGSEFPNQIIVVGGHLDCWDIAPGAHDDGAGIAQSIEVLRIFKSLGLRPKHTIRCVLFVNEENGSAGATAYAAEARNSNERNIFAIETDAGGFDPKGFNLSNTNKDAASRAQRWLPFLTSHGITFIVDGGAGADVSPLGPLGTIVGELRPDSQRYFDYHHTVKDTLDHVNPRELELGAAALASLIWLEDTDSL
jgi:Zn-dependent M28 family amino/carboxypeptidase